MSYKIGSNAFLFESDGKAILVAKTLNHEAGNTGSMTSPSLPTVGVTSNITLGSLKEGYVDDAFFTFQGSTSGYASGGYQNPNAPLTKIDKFPFSADNNATDVGDLSQTRGGAGQSSTSHGYTAGGAYGPSVGSKSNRIDKFPFSISSGTAAVAGYLQLATSFLAGQSSGASGYVTGGNAPPYSNYIQKFPVSSDANAVYIGTLTIPRSNITGNSSTTHGYTSGSLATFGFPANVIDKFPFASDDNATDVGDLLTPAAYGAGSNGQSSTTHGYHSGGVSSPPYVIEDTIQKFTFSADANSTDVGNLISNHTSTTGQSSTTHGYVSGGSNDFTNTIQKFTFASDNNATDVGDMTGETFIAAGQQI